MARLQTHLKQTFFAGFFAALPIAITVIVLAYVETKTRQSVEQLFGSKYNYPFIGVAVAILLVYLTGIIVTSIIGKYLLSQVDRALSHLPGMKDVYRAWKQISLTPQGSGGIFAKVVLMRDETGRFWMIGFSTGSAIPSDPTMTCVFVPASPNPTSGKLYFAKLDQIRILNMTADEAFKLILSGGTYVPAAIGAATSDEPAPNLLPPGMA